MPTPTREVENSSTNSVAVALPAPAKPSPGAAPSSRVALKFLLAALLVGGLARAYSLFQLPFAINDGGLFWAMTRAVADHNFALPARVFYPTTTTMASASELPFCYPPLGFYVAALAFKIGVPLDAIFRWLPWGWSMATIGAFWRLARAFCKGEANGEWAAGAATLCWALLPWSFAWNVMGGGLTRAPGLVWAFLALEAALGLWRDGQTKKWLPALIFLALALATHLERARFAVVGVGLIWLFWGRNWRGAAQLVGVTAGAALLTAPWWGGCLARFGAEPFVAAARSGGGDWGEGSPLQQLFAAASFTLGGEAIAPLFHLVGGAGLVWCLWRRRWFLPVWFAVILLLEVRSGRTFVLAPLTLGAGVLLAQMPRARAPVVGVLAVWLCLLCVAVQRAMPGLSSNDLAAIAWAKENAPANARFLVLPGQQWAMDAPGEWFPALSERASVATVQGAEWLPGDEFRRRRTRHDALRKARAWQTVASVIARDDLKFDWIWRPDGAPPLAPGAGWHKEWSRGENAIWRRAARLN